MFPSLNVWNRKCLSKVSTVPLLRFIASLSQFHLNCIFNAPQRTRKFGHQIKSEECVSCSLKRLVSSVSFSLSSMIWLIRIPTFISPVATLSTHTWNHRTGEWHIQMVQFDEFLCQCVCNCSSIFHYFGNSLNDSDHSYNVKIISYIEFAFGIYYIFCFGAIIQMANSLTTEAEKIAPKIHRLILDGHVSEELQIFVSKTK